MSQFQFTRPSAFPPVIKNLIIINVLIFIAQQTFGDHPNTLDNLFALHDAHSPLFKPHQILTYIFMHGGIEHLLFNMLALWMFGTQLENYWGSKRFLQFYLICGLGAGLLHLGVLYIQSDAIWEEVRQLSSITPNYKEVISSPQAAYKGYYLNAYTVGASGSIFGCLAAFGMLFPNQVIYIYALLPIKAKWFVILYGALELFLGIRNSAGDNVAHFAHLGGAVAGIIIILIWNKTNRKTLY